MTPSAHCRAFIKQFEGLRTKAYPCPAGYITIGYGHAQGVKIGDIITEAEAENLLDADLTYFGNAISAKARRDGITLSQNEFDALVSFAFNLKGGAPRLFASTLWSKLKAGDRQGAANEFPRWNKAHDNSGNVITLAGLTRRREAERAMFLGN